VAQFLRDIIQSFQHLQVEVATVPLIQVKVQLIEQHPLPQLMEELPLVLTKEQVTVDRRQLTEQE